MIEYVPDNYDAFLIHEREAERFERLNRKVEVEETVEKEDVL